MHTTKTTLLILLTLLAITLGCLSTQPEKPLLIGFQSTPASALVQVAAEKGFFKENKLNVEIQEFTAGKFALQAFLANSLDFAVVGDVPVALAALQGNQFEVLTETGENNPEDPVLVHDEGISDPKEYFAVKKRKIATSLGGTPEFSTYLFLKHYGISQDSVEIIAQKPEDTPASFASGSVDAISIFEPYPTIAEKVFSGAVKRFTLPADVYPTKYVLVGKKEWAAKNPEAAQKLIKALIEAEQFIHSNPLEAQQIVSKRSKFSIDLVQKTWLTHTFKVQLSDQLLKNWTAEKEWAIETGKIKDNSAVNFGQLLQKDLLKEFGRD